MKNFTRGFFYVKITFVNTASINQTLPLNKISSSKVLSQGDSVFVRVTADKGQGKYEATLSGAKITLNSKRPLQVGSSFPAKVNINNGKLEIIISLNKENLLQTALTSLPNKEIAGLLSASGLPQNNLSLNLIKQMYQLELKMDSFSLKKFYNLALKFKGKEKSALQLLMILYKKKMEVSEDELLELLSYLDGSFEAESDRGGNGQRGGKEAFELLKRNNSIKQGWLFYPFELINYKSRELYGKGCIKIFLNSAEKIEKLNFNCNYRGKEYYFYINYKNSRMEKVNFYIENEASSVSELEKKISSLFTRAGKNVEVSWCQKDMFEVSGSDFEGLYTFSGEV